MKLALPLLLVGLVPACATGLDVDTAARETLELPVRLENRRPQVLEVQFHRGFMVVQTGQALECQLRVDLTGGSQRELADLRSQIRPSIVEAPARTVLRIGLPAGSRLDSIQTRYLLRVPPEVKLVVVTREGSVYLRDFAGDVEVTAGRGVIEAELDGGIAELSTGSGSISLRGSYAAASVSSDTGRIRVCLPPAPVTRVDLEVRSRGGETSLDLPEGSAFALHYRGDDSLLRPDSLVELSWLEVGDEGGEEYLIGRIGRQQGGLDGRIRVQSSKAVVRLRRLPGARP